MSEGSPYVVGVRGMGDEFTIADWRRYRDHAVALGCFSSSTTDRTDLDTARYIAMQSLGLATGLICPGRMPDPIFDAGLRPEPSPPEATLRSRDHSEPQSLAPSIFARACRSAGSALLRFAAAAESRSANPSRKSRPSKPPSSLCGSATIAEAGEAASLPGGGCGR